MRSVSEMSMFLIRKLTGDFSLLLWQNVTGVFKFKGFNNKPESSPSSTFNLRKSVNFPHQLMNHCIMSTFQTADPYQLHSISNSSINFFT